MGSSTRVTRALIGCPDPDPIYTRYFTPTRNELPPDLDTIGAAYIGVMAQEIQDWLTTVPVEAPVGVCFSGGIDSGAVFLVTYHVMRKLGMSPARLKAFTLTDGAGEDLEQAREFLKRLDLELFLEAIEFDPRALDVRETINTQPSREMLQDWITAAMAADSLQAFIGVLRR